MAALGMMAEAANARLLHERVESVREQLAQLQNQVERYDAVAETLTELPRRLSHLVMVPLGKRAMGRARSCAPTTFWLMWVMMSSPGDWRRRPSRSSRARGSTPQVKRENLRELEATTTDVGSVAQLRKTYEAENIREIQETEAASELGPVPRATEDDIKEYFEV
ncbi:hypothetical protein PR003_g34794 [Phytophthora rubi]|uniref:Uncharacterized protein n=1 Tax=Phytophthora rubi TaxID=129364 RepID=A0A6A4APX9_9STRA|nr:hypothetical protein PR003_g34794 [Phytophthora rubi]